MFESDILVVGGGPAGLLTASALAGQHSVALIEKSTLGETSKYWATTSNRLERLGLADCIRHRSPAMIAGTFLGSMVRIPGTIAVVNEHLLLERLIARCRDAGIAMFDKAGLLSLAWQDGTICATTTSGESYRSRILVDASGGSSLIAKTFRSQTIDGFFSIYGAHFTDIDLHQPDTILAHISQLGDPPPILEVIPTGATSAYCAIFVYSRKLVSPHTLRDIFDLHCHHNIFFSLTRNTSAGTAKSGAIPIGRKSRTQLRNIIAIGEAAMIQPPLLGTAFNEILEHHGATVEAISRAVLNPDRRAMVQYPAIKAVQDAIQRTLIQRLLSGTVEDFDLMIKILSHLPNDDLYRLCSNELTWSAIARAGVSVPFSLARSAVTGAL